MKKQKSMWMCLCIVFGCCFLALTGNAQVHATVNNDVSTETNVGKLDTQSKKSVNGQDATIDQKSTDTNAANESDTTFEPNDQGVYEIDSYAKLKQFATVVNEGNTNVNAKLTADIECKNDNGTSATDWTPIGNYDDSDQNNVVDHKYTGTFDGQDHVITGLNNNDNPTKYGGLFGYVGPGGTVQNIGLKDANLKGIESVGAVAGTIDKDVTVQNCYNIGGTIANFTDADTTKAYIGGVVGDNNTGTVKNCYNTGTVKAIGSSKASGVRSGGIVGLNNGSILKCYNTGAVSAINSGDGSNALGGGIAGLSNFEVIDCYNTGAISATESGSDALTRSGGVIGNNNGKVQKCYNLGTVNVINSGDSINAYVGGVTGYNRGIGYSDNNAVIDCYNMGAISAICSAKDDNIAAGGVVGWNGSTVQNCYNTGKVNVSIKGTCKETNVAGVVGDGFGIIQECYNIGSVNVINESAEFGSAYQTRIGGVTGEIYSLVQNCYNIGTVKYEVKNYNKESANNDCAYVGGVAGILMAENGYLGKAENCYNAGTISIEPNTHSDTIDVGGVVGAVLVPDKASAVKTCYYDSSICKATKSIGNVDDTTTGKLTTAQMTGTNALENMKGFSGTDSSNVWFTKADARDGDKDYWFYPHLKGFNIKNAKGEPKNDWPLGIADGDQQMDPVDITAAAWPPRVEVSVVWSEKESYIYNGRDQKSKVTSVTVGDGLVLEEGKDYTVVYQQQNGTEWKTVQDCVDAGTYKVTITFKTSGHADIEKEFVIDSIPLPSDSKVYNATDLTKDSCIGTDLDLCDSTVYRTSDVISTKALFELELLIMLSIMGLCFSCRKRKN